MEKQKIYFPNLNGIRFIAAFLVIIHHIEQFKFISTFENYWETVPFIRIIGNLGVILFFVLSGFLITFLLLSEENTFKVIDIKAFYIRRILRIWPLYFLILLLAFAILPNIQLFTLPGLGKDVIYTDLGLKVFLYVIFLPNMVLPLLGIVPYVSHTWSIGTEEQFYLVWPVILKYFKKFRLSLMLFIVFFYMAFAKFLISPYAKSLPNKNTIIFFWSSFNIDCMAIGGIFAILLFQKHNMLRYLINNILCYTTIISVILMMINSIYIPYIHYEFYSVLFGIIILNFAQNEQLKFSLEQAVFKYLGNISYGLYMYHPIGIVFSLFVCKLLNLTSNWFIYPLSFMVTIFLASISYQYFEKYFLKYKYKFSKISSGNETKL